MRTLSRSYGLADIWTTMFMVLLLIVVAALSCGCVTAPQAVKESNLGAIALLQSAIERNNTAIDALVTEMVGLNEERYAREFAMVERTLLEEQGNTGLVDLARYKTLGAMFGEEIAKGEAYYRARGDQLKQAIASPIVLSLALLQGQQKYLEAQGIPDETFNNLVDASFGLGEKLKTTYDQYESAKAAEEAAKEAAKQEQIEALRLRVETGFNNLIGAIRSRTTAPGVTP